VVLIAVVVVIAVISAIRKRLPEYPSEPDANSPVECPCSVL